MPIPVPLLSEFRCLWNAQSVRERRGEDVWVSLYHPSMSWVGEYEVCRQHWRAQPQSWTYFKILHLFLGKKKKRKCNSKRNMNHRALLWANESIPSAFQRHQKHGLKFHLNIVENRDTRLNCKKVMAFLVKIECALLGVIFSEYYAHGNVRKILNILSL